MNAPKIDLRHAAMLVQFMQKMVKFNQPVIGLYKLQIIHRQDEKLLFETFREVGRTVKTAVVGDFIDILFSFFQQFPGFGEAEVFQ
jgi:hypothetical protein